MSKSYFQGGDALSLTSDQIRILASVRRMLVSLESPFVTPHETTALLENSDDLVLNVFHSQTPGLKLSICVSRDGELSITCAGLHPTFFLKYNTVFEPDESLGDLLAAEKTIQALLEGKVESEVYWDAGRTEIAKSVDYLVDPLAKDRKLYTQYHGEGIIMALGTSICEQRAISFIDKQGIRISSCENNRKSWNRQRLSRLLRGMRYRGK